MHTRNKPNIVDFTPGQAVSGSRGMVCTSQPLAAEAGIDILKQGGNAIDAAVAAAAAMTVVEPVMNGIGGDAFALIWYQNRLYGINGSGPAPQSLSPEAIRAMGCGRMPSDGWASVTVPGAVSVWRQLARRFGRLPFAECLQPSISYARKGFDVTPVISRIWEKEYKKFQDNLPDSLFQIWATAFSDAENLRAPLSGERWCQPDQGNTLEEIARSEGESFYRGDIARQIHDAFRNAGGFLQQSDLAAYEASWVDPIATEYHGYTVYEIPPNGHGIVTLMALNILSEYEQNACRLTGDDRLHAQIEALKLAFTDGLHTITDPAYMSVSVEQLLSRHRADLRSREIGEQALLPAPGSFTSGGTIYLCTADGEGNMVSLIQSNYKGFGSGVVIPGTGIAMNNRGRDFSLNPQDANYLQPGKKSYHTIIPGFLCRHTGEPVGPFGVMGGMMQPQGHLQVLINQIDNGMDPQQALDAPRWRWDGGRTIALEPIVPQSVKHVLDQRGHCTVHADDFLEFGRGQIIRKEADGTYLGGSESRADGRCAVW